MLKSNQVNQAKWIAIFVAFGAGRTAIAAVDTSDPSAISQAISHCVQQVRGTTPPSKSMASYWKTFDAYLDPASRKVHTNATIRGRTGTDFVFLKCMSELGIPLEDK